VASGLLGSGAGMTSSRIARVPLSGSALIAIIINAAGGFLALPSTAIASSATQVARSKLDAELTRRSNRRASGGTTRVIVTLQPGAPVPSELQPFVRGRRFNIINGQVADLPNDQLNRFAAYPSVFSIHYDRPTGTTNFRTSVTVGANIAQRLLGLSGAGVGVAVIDSGVAMFHDDFTNRLGPTTSPFGNQRVAAFVDFVNGHPSPYDDNGHGTHVTGIIAGNGYDSGGQRAGMAPDASLVSLKVLDADGRGTISNIIAALEWVLSNHTTYNIRIVNLSVGAGIYESYWTDPLTLAAKRLVDAGIVVVASAGNLGKNAAGKPQYGGITAPGNAPWVLTVGASSTMGTTTRTDDTVAGYSSRGPTYLDWAAKPDLVAPGTGTESPAAPESSFYSTKADFLLPGTVSTAFLPYLSLSGTSMAAPVVSGTVALMLQANPALTPNAVKAILQYTSQTYPGYNALTEGAGFLNALGALRLARFFATAKPDAVIPVQRMWSKHIIWGNHQLRRGVPLPNANAWRLGVTWGDVKTDTGQKVAWGQACAVQACNGAAWNASPSDKTIWGSSGDDNIVWGDSGDDDNIVWGDACGGNNCDNIVWGSSGDDNIVWGDNGDDNIVWGDNGADNTVWAGAAASGTKWRDPVPAPSSGALIGDVWAPWVRDLPDWLTDEMLFGLLPPPPTPPGPPPPGASQSGAR
jgi:subtilisin family serine protease